MYFLLILAFISQTAYSALQEPTCLSQFDYEHKMLYKLIKIEEEVNSFRTFIDEMKKNQIQAQADQKQKQDTALENFKTVSEALVQDTTEKSEQLFQHMEDVHVNMTDSFKKQQQTLVQDTTERSEQLFQHMEDARANMTELFKRLQRKPAVGFSVKNPKAGLKSGEITFDKVITNAGDSFNQTSGWFKCNVPGYYFIMASLLKEFSYVSSSYCYIYKNDNDLVIAYTYPGHSPAKGYYSASNSVFVHLNKGDIIKLTRCTKITSLYSYSSFSGFLVTADSDPPM